MMMDDDDDPPNKRRATDKPETEEEKRKNFLERNRQGTIYFQITIHHSILIYRSAFHRHLHASLDRIDADWPLFPLPPAALKCRQRKKAWLSQLQADNEHLKNENQRLTSALVSAREEISRLSALVGSSAISANHPHHQPNANESAAPVSVSVSIPGAAAKAAGLSTRRDNKGYGY